MAKILIYSPVVPAFTYVAGQTYFTEMFHHAMLKNLEALSDGGRLWSSLLKPNFNLRMRHLRLGCRLLRVG